MKTQAIVALIAHHGINSLAVVTTTQGYTYTRGSSNGAHEFIDLPAHEMMAIRRVPIENSTLEYISYSDIVKLGFPVGTTPILATNRSDIEGVAVNQVRRFVFVTTTDNQSTPLDYPAWSIGLPKITRTFNSDAIVGDPCVEVVMRYKSENTNRLPSHISRVSTTVVLADL
jgi:hypothetical protein